MILQELVEITYKISLCKIGDAKDLIISDYELNNCQALAANLSVVILSRFWQMFNKALIEMKSSYNELHTLEMTLIKVTYANLTISPEDILRDISELKTNIPQHNTFQQEIKKKVMATKQ